MPATKKPTADATTPTLTTKNCLICEKEFVPILETSLTCNLRCQITRWSQMTEQELKAIDCAYCGALATDVDHVPPRSARPQIQALGLDLPFYTLPACSECNSSILGRLAFWTYRERVEHVVAKLPRRHGRVLAMPDWSEEELRDMGYGMRMQIKQGMENKRIVQSRIDFAKQALAAATALEQAGVKNGHI